VRRRSKVEAGVYYHGTGLKHLDVIMDRGLLPGGGDGWSSKGSEDELYFSGFSRAARYAMEFDDPVVLKVRISTPQRLNKIRTDPKGDPRRDFSVSPQMGSRPINREDHQDPLYTLRKRLQNVADRRRWPLDFAPSSSDVLPQYKDRTDPDYEDEITQFNLYRRVKRTLRDVYSKNKADNEYDVFIDRFRPGQFGNVHIRDDGSLTFDSSYWESKHHMTYPEALPPASIKEIWAGERLLDRYGIRPRDRVEIEVDRIPDERLRHTRTLNGKLNRVPGILRNRGFRSAYRHIEEIRRLYRNDPGVLQEYEKIVDRMETRMTNHGSPEDAADVVEALLSRLLHDPSSIYDHADTQNLYNYDYTFGLVDAQDLNLNGPDQLRLDI
jgi:hypothetical protein